jgi:hypothetical protein
VPLTSNTPAEQYSCCCQHPHPIFGPNRKGEEPLVRYCGKERVGNRFCLRLQDAEGLMDYLFMLFRQGHTSLKHIHGDAVRYASINVAATSKYGSLEFRSLKGNMDVDYITTWLQALDNLRSFAKEHANPQVIHDLFVNSTPEQFAEIVLGDVYPAFAYPEMEMEMRRGHRTRAGTRVHSVAAAR